MRLSSKYNEYLAFMDFLTKTGEKSIEFGKHTIRYALIRLREELLEDLLPEDDDSALKSKAFYLSKGCYSFELNPILYNLPNRKTNGRITSRDVLRVLGMKHIPKYLPYIRMKYLTETTGELFHPKQEIEYEQGDQTIYAYNTLLSDWDRAHGQELKERTPPSFCAIFWSSRQVVMMDNSC